MEEKQILVLIKEPGKPADLEPLFDNTLEAFQKAVGGYIEAVTIRDDLVVICNEEGRLMGLQPNVQINGVDFVGTVIVAGVKGESFSSIKASLVPKVWKVLENGGWIR